MYVYMSENVSVSMIMSADMSLTVNLSKTWSVSRIISLTAESK